MRQVTRKGLMTVAAATGVIAAAGGTAQAHSGASGSSSNSPGVLSGNTVQAPVHAPVNACGNTVNVVGVLNPAVGNTCVNQSVRSGGAQSDGYASDSPGVASGNHVQVPVYAPVNVCGNSVNVVGVGNGATGNDCGNGGGSGDGGGEYGNPPGAPERPGNPGGPENPGDSGNHPGNPDNPSDRDNPDESPRPETPSTPSTPSTSGDVTPDGTPQADLPGAGSVTEPDGLAQLAATGSELPLGLVLPMGAGVMLAGAVLYRKGRASA